MSKTRFDKLEQLFDVEDVKLYGLKGLHVNQFQELFLYKVISVLYRFGDKEQDELFDKEIRLPIEESKFGTF